MVENLGNYKIDDYLEQLNEKRVSLKQQSDRVKQLISEKTKELKDVEDRLMAYQAKLQDVTRKYFRLKLTRCRETAA